MWASLRLAPIIVYPVGGLNFAVYIAITEVTCPLPFRVYAPLVLLYHPIALITVVATIISF